MFKKIKKRVKKFFSRKRTLNLSMQTYHVDDSEFLHISMGISQERFNEISKIINQLYAPGNSTIGMITSLSKECKDPQELAFSMYILGVITEKVKNPLFWEKYV